MKQISKLRVNKENLVNSPEIKNILLDTTKKIDDIVPKKQFDFESMTVRDISKLKKPADRIEAGKSYLGGRDLTPNQEKAIIEAHKVGIAREGAGIYNYTFREKGEKLKILEEAGFTKIERKILLEKGVCGKPIDFDKADTLEMKGTYELNKIKGLSVIEASKRLESFSNSIDIKYLVNHPTRIDNMLDIMGDMCYYIDNNIDDILKLNKNELVDFKSNFLLLKKNAGKLLNDNRLEPSYRKDIEEILGKNIKNGFYKLNPNLAPKN